VFLAFLEQVLLPALRGRPEAIVVLDNLGAHKAERVRDALEAAKVSYRHLPSYAPDLNPCMDDPRSARVLSTRMIGSGCSPVSGLGCDPRVASLDG
jgi:hypothetical protein